MIKQATILDCLSATELALELWPGHDESEMTDVIRAYINSDTSAIFIQYEQDYAKGISICTLRSDYVEGTTSSPVGYLEGIYVRPDHERQGHATQLLSYAQQWAKAKGCSEFGSDCEFNNTNSLLFHLKLGFEEANRIICFTKKL